VLDTRNGIGAPAGMISTITLSFASIASVPNHTSASTVTLETAIGGTLSNVDASLVIQQLSSGPVRADPADAAAADDT
jgi:hypothetical protein